MPITNGGNILVLAGGSGGDVYPPLAIAKALRGRGHRVLFVTSPFFEPAVRRLGVDFQGIGTAEEYLEGLRNPDLWKFGRGFKVLVGAMLRKMPDVYSLIRERYVPGETLVIAPVGMFGARLANEKLGVPLVQYHIGIAALRSCHEQPGVALPQVLKPAMWPLRKLVLAGLDRWFFDPAITPQLNAFRRELGLPPVRRVFAKWVHSPLLQIGLFPEWFLPPQSDWPANTHLTGFPLLDTAEVPELPAEVSRFLEERSDAPIVFTWGTAMRFAGELLSLSVEVCRILGRRGVLLTKFPDQVPPNLPDTVRHFDYVPLSALLPKSAALVHHGGIGSMAQAFAAGIPQFVTPFNFDQPMNAARLRVLGAGDAIAPGRYRPRRVASKLRNLLESPATTEACRALKAEIERSNPIEETIRLVESVMTPAFQRAAGG